MARNDAPPKLDDWDLPDLTDKQLAFVESLLSGMGVADAYRASRDCSGMADATIAANASREHYRPAIQAWLAAAKMAKLGKLVSTKEEHETQLVRIRELAITAGDMKAAGAMEIARGRLNNHYVETHEHIIINPAEILDKIRSIAPDVASALANRFFPGQTIEARASRATDD